MIEIETRPAGEVEIPLEEEDTHRKSVAPELPPRLTLGQPVVIELTKKLLEKDPEAAASLQQHKDQVFHLVRLACTFHPAAGRRFTEAWLRVQCAPAPETIAWSMLPQRDADIDESSMKVQLGFDLKLLGIGLKPGVEESRSTKRVRPFIDARNLQQSDPQWQFKPTDARELEGSFPLALVLRSPRKGRCAGAISFRCVVERKSFGLFTFVTPGPVRGLEFHVHD